MQVNARSTHARTSPERVSAGRDVNGSIDDWRLQALCAQTDPEEFFPDKGGSVRTALAVCAGCPVRAECLDFALDNDERFGVWGGTTERERRELRRERQEAELGPAVPGLTPRGGGKWGVRVGYRRLDGRAAQLATTVTGTREDAARRLVELRDRAAELAAATPDHAVQGVR